MDQINFELLAMKFAQSGLTFRRLERETQVSRGTLHNVMTGTHLPSYPVAYQLSRALVLTQEDLIAIYFPHAKSEKEEKEITL